MSLVCGEVLTFGQEKGPEVSLRVFGDEFCSRHEELNGYSVLYDRSLGLFCYAKLDGSFLKSTGIPLDQLPPPGLARHLQESPEVREIRTRDGIRAKRGPGALSPDCMMTSGPNEGLLQGRQLNSGQVRGLTILVNFADVETSVTASDVTEMLNAEGYSRNGNICSVREYFLRMSSHKLNYTNTVVGPLKLSQPRSYYVQNLLVEEALQLAVAKGVDLKQFDSRNEGVIDALSILYAGQTQYYGELWPHNARVDLDLGGGMRAELYMLTSAGRSANELSIGTFCHETGHLLCRFPDLYDYGNRDGNSVHSAGLGTYCVMGSGNHLDSGRSPSPICAFLRGLAKWCDTVIDLSNAGPFQARQGYYGTLLKYPTSKPNEYFLAENRIKTELDRALPASGLAIYHCDIYGSNEWEEGSPTRHYQCALLQADGHRHLELNVNEGDGSDLFGNAQGAVLSGQSTPCTREWDGRDSGLVISDITIDDENIIKFTMGQSVAPRTVTAEASPGIPIPDNDPEGIASVLSIAQSGIVSSIQVEVDIAHSCIGDLRVELYSPGGKRAILHARRGGSDDNLIATYDSSRLGELNSMVGQAMQGKWMLRVADLAAEDTGTLRAWRIKLSSAGVGEPPTLAAAR